jgi:hypothetical protein
MASEFYTSFINISSILFYIPYFFSPRRKASRSVRISSFFNLSISCSGFLSDCPNVITMLFVSCPYFAATGMRQNSEYIVQHFNVLSFLASLLTDRGVALHRLQILLSTFQMFVLCR